MLRLYCLLTGDDYRLVSVDTPASKRKIGLLATCLLVPVIMWFGTSALLVNQVLMAPVVTAIIAGAAIALVIFAIERSIIMSNGSKIIAFFRICLGLNVALLGSIALDEVIFKTDIDQQVAEERQSAVVKAVSQIDADFGQLRSKQEGIVKERYLLWQKSLEELNNEMKGKPGSSGHVGRGAIADEDIKIAELEHFDYETAKTEVLKAEQLTEKQKDEARVRVEGIWSNRSLLNRLKAMFDLLAKDKYMLGVYLLFTAFLFFLEFLVVVFKMCSEETNYERRIKLIERVGGERMKRIENKDSILFNPSEVYHQATEARAAIGRPLSGVFS